MKQSAVLLPLTLAAMMFLSYEADAQPTEITACGMISQSGPYELANKLTFTGNSGACLQITADFVTIDLAGFSISGSGIAGPTTAIEADNTTTGIAVRNGSISGFAAGVNLGGADSIVEGLQVFGIGGQPPTGINYGITANGIVRGNIVLDFHSDGNLGDVWGIGGAGTVIGNLVSGNAGGMFIGQGTTVIANLVINNLDFGIVASCPSNVTANTAVNSRFANLYLVSNGCNNTDNLLTP